MQGLGGSGLVVVDLQFCFVELVSSYNSRNRTVIWPQSGDPPFDVSSREFFFPDVTLRSQSPNISLLLAAGLATRDAVFRRYSIGSLPLWCGFLKLVVQILLAS